MGRCNAGRTRDSAAVVEHSYRPQRCLGPTGGIMGGGAVSCAVGGFALPEHRRIHQRGGPSVGVAGLAGRGGLGWRGHAAALASGGRGGIGVGGIGA